MAPENTIDSLKAAIEHKVDAVEFDVRTTADGLPILIHDSKIRGVKVSRMDFQKLKKIEPSLATLDEAMRFLHKKAKAVIEVKPGSDTEPIIETIKDRVRNGWRADDISVSSFEYKTLSEIKRHLPDIAIIVNEAWSGVRASRRARKLGTRFVTMNQKWLWNGFVKALIRRGLKLSVYTVNTQAKAEKLKRLGVYSIITDNPDKIVKP